MAYGVAFGIDPCVEDYREISQKTDLYLIQSSEVKTYLLWITNNVSNVSGYFLPRNLYGCLKIVSGFSQNHLSLQEKFGHILRGALFCYSASGLPLSHVVLPIVLSADVLSTIRNYSKEWYGISCSL